MTREEKQQHLHDLQEKILAMVDDYMDKINEPILYLGLATIDIDDDPPESLLSGNGEMLFGCALMSEAIEQVCGGIPTGAIN